MSNGGQLMFSPEPAVKPGTGDYSAIQYASTSGSPVRAKTSPRCRAEVGTANAGLPISLVKGPYWAPETGIPDLKVERIGGVDIGLIANTSYPGIYEGVEMLGIGAFSVCRLVTTGVADLAGTSFSPPLFGRVVEFSVPRSEASARDQARDAVILELESYRDLTDGWDGIGSKAPAATAITEALSFLDRALPVGLPAPEPMVDADGEVGLFWEGPNYHVEAGFKGREVISFYGRVEERIEKGAQPFHAHSALPKALLEMLSLVRDRA